MGTVTATSSRLHNSRPDAKMAPSRVDSNQEEEKLKRMEEVGNVLFGFPGQGPGTLTDYCV